MICLKVKNYNKDELSILYRSLLISHDALSDKYCQCVCEHCDVYKLCQDLSQARFFLEKKLDEL